MFPPGSFAVGVSVASTVEPPPEECDWPPDPDPWPSRLGDQLRVADMTDTHIATHLRGLQALRAQIDAFQAQLIDGLAGRRPAYRDRQPGQPGAASSVWAAELLDSGVSEFFPDELSTLLACAPAQATTEWEISATLVRRLPRVLAAAADGLLDRPRMRAIAEELGWPAKDTPDPLLAQVEAVVLPRAMELSVTKLRALCAAELIKVDPGAADRRRQTARRTADVTVRGLRDGMAELRSVAGAPDVAAMRAEVDARARAVKAAGDQRPIGLLRTLVLQQLVLGPEAERPAVGARIDVVAHLEALEAAAAGAPGAGIDPPTVEGWPVTPAQARELLERIDALCPGGLQPPTTGSLIFSVVDGFGRQLAAVTRGELEQAVRRGEGLGPPLPVDRYEPSPAQQRFVKTRDRGCRQPDCPLKAGWADLDHVIAHADGGETDCTNLCCLCRRHHRLKTFAPGWTYTMTPDGVLTVTTPSGVTRISRPPGMPPPGDDPPPF